MHARRIKSPRLAVFSVLWSKAKPFAILFGPRKRDFYVNNAINLRHINTDYVDCGIKVPRLLAHSNLFFSLSHFFPRGHFLFLSMSQVAKLLRSFALIKCQAGRRREPRDATSLDERARFTECLINVTFNSSYDTITLIFLSSFVFSSPLAIFRSRSLSLSFNFSFFLSFKM